MKKVKLKLFFILCLLIAYSNSFAQIAIEVEHEDCEVVVTRADIERCAMYKRQTQLLEREIKFQAVEAVSKKDSAQAREDTLQKHISTLQNERLKLNISLANEIKAKEKSNTWVLYLTIALLLSILFSVFKSKLARFIPFLGLLISINSFAQDPAYRPPFSLNSQKGITQKIVIDTLATKYEIISANDVHTIKVPALKYQKSIAPGYTTQYWRGDKTWQLLTKSAVGLPNVDNTSDANKPLSNDAIGALSGKIDGSNTYTGNFGIFAKKKIFGLPSPPDFLPNIFWVSQYFEPDDIDLQSELGINTKANASDFAKFNNVTILDSATFTHSLGTQKITVSFYENQTKEVSFIDYYPDTGNTIKVYLPYRDKPTKYKFVGDVFIIKRY